MFGLGLPELLLILAVVVIVFGAKKIPQLGAGLGQGLRTFRKAFRETREEDEGPPASPGPDRAAPPQPPRT